MLSELDDLAFRESVFAWLRNQMPLTDYVVHVKESVLDTFDGPTLQHSIKEMNGELLRQLPQSRAEQPDRELLAERFETFVAVG